MVADKRSPIQITLSLAHIIPAFEKFIQNEDRKLQFEGALIIAFYAKQINKLKELISTGNNLSAEENEKFNLLTEILALINESNVDLNKKFKYLYKYVPTIIGEGYTKKFELTPSQESFLTAFKKDCNIELFKQLTQPIELSMFSFKIQFVNKETPEFIMLDFNILSFAFDLFEQEENKKQQFYGACVIAYYCWKLCTHKSYSSQSFANTISQEFKTDSAEFLLWKKFITQLKVVGQETQYYPQHNYYKVGMIEENAQRILKKNYFTPMWRKAKRAENLNPASTGHFSQPHTPLEQQDSKEQNNVSKGSGFRCNLL